MALFAVITFFSCQQVEDVPPQQGKTIFYYPTSNVYFDADNNHYLVLSGADGWVTKEELSPEQAENLGRKVLVSHPAVPVWKANGDHKMIYGASLYTTEQDYRQKFTEDSLNSLQKKTAVTFERQTQDTTEERKEKKGVGKLLDRLFGKEKKKRENK